MIKRTIYLGNPAYVKVQQAQLCLEMPEAKAGEKVRQIPIEDIGMVLLDHPRITITQLAIVQLLENNAVILFCDQKHHPGGLLIPFEGHSLLSARYRAQIEASQPLRKQLWQQTVRQKVINQACLLEKKDKLFAPLLRWSREIQSGDATNVEAKAAAFYWSHLFENHPLGFLRERSGEAPNALLNYGYAVLRAIVARGLVCSGLLPALGIHHRNQYNAFCLADDMMEPYRPFVDNIVYDMWSEDPESADKIDKDKKSRLLSLPAIDIAIEGAKSPLMVGLQRTTNSLAACFSGEKRNLLLPAFI